ncbi:hypothetical protein ABZX40_18015 [Streptomyces sp. NPDC004610]|uniref:hypothetical protein n=1 Tax=unclassified Streptomyces TaxID=2593676 RepID=UPI0033ACB96D
MPFETWQPGMIITEERLAAISPTWQDWTPAWTTSTGNATPSLGDAAVTARYAVAATTVHYELVITFGATTNFGSSPGSADNWRLSLPVEAAATTTMAGWGEITDTSAGVGSRTRVRVRLTTTSHMELEMSGPRIDGTALAGPGLIDSASPWVWANGDIVRLMGTYEAAV